MFYKKKVEDQFDKILYTDDTQQKAILLKKQIEFFKTQKPNFEYDYQNFLTLIEEFQNSTNIEYNLIWLQAINEIVRLNPNMKKKYFKIVMKMIFSKQIDEYNKFDKDIKEEINKTIINCISIFTNECEEIFQCDSYFQNFTHLKNLLKLFIIDLFPHYCNKDNNKLLLLISNIFFNINKNKENYNYLKNNYFSVMFNLLIENLCFLCLFNLFKIFESKIRTSFSLIELNKNTINETEKKVVINNAELGKNKYVDLINKSNKLFDLYLNIDEKNNLDLIINYQIFIKIFIIHCLESQYNESYCIEWFQKIYNRFRINKILKIITETFDDEIFNLFYIKGNSFIEETNSDKKKIKIKDKLNSVNNFFYLCENRTKEMEYKNLHFNFINKFSKLRIKLIESKEYMYNGIFILINLLFNEILSKQATTINLREEFIIITLIKCVIKYIIKTNVVEMIEDNKNNIDNLINLLIDRFGSSMSEKIWNELMVLIKCFYIENEEKCSIKQISVILKKMMRLKINGTYQFDLKMFNDLINKVCESKNNHYIIKEYYFLFAIYFKNKFNTLKTMDKSISSFTKLFISMIKEKYDLFENNNNKNNKLPITKEIPNINNKQQEINSNVEKVLEMFACYTLIYFTSYSKYENKNIELFLYNNLNYLNFYFCTNKKLQPQYINLIINVLNNTTDLIFFQYAVNYIITLHINESQEEEHIKTLLKFYKKIIIKLIIKLSNTYQIKKLKHIFDSIYSRINAYVNEDIDFNFWKNILEIFTYMNVTKYNEILINKKIVSKMKTVDLIRKNYFSIGKPIYSSILVNDNKNISKEILKEWCVIDIKEIFVILMKLLKKKNIYFKCKQEIINFIHDKINDIFFFNKINIDMFIDYVIELDNDNMNEYLLFTNKVDIILTINDILKSIAYFFANNKTLFSIQNYEETFKKLINYTFEKINYFNKIIRIMIKKYNIKVIKNKNSKHFIFMKNLLGSDENRMPNILNLRIEQNDFKFINKDIEKDINYQIFIDEDININQFVYPKKNFGEMLNYLKSYLDILEISLNSIIYNNIKNMNNNLNPPFIQQIETELKICFNKTIKINEQIENNETSKIKEEIIYNEQINKFENYCEKLLKIFNRFPSIIKYQNNFLYDIYKLFLFCKDFIIFCGEKYIIQTILILISISLHEFYPKIFAKLNNEFKVKYNNGKDFDFKKIETIQIIDDISSKTSSKDKGSQKMSSSKTIHSKNSFIDNKSNSEMSLHNEDKKDYYNYISKSVVNLQKEIEKYTDNNLDRIKTIDENNDNHDNNLNINITSEKKDIEEPINEENYATQNKLFLLRKLIIEFIIKSKDSLKIYNIINDILKENTQENDEGIIIFLLLCKWRIINEHYLNRNEDINIFRNRNKIKNLFNNDIYNISIENSEQKKTIRIKSPILSFNYMINNNYKNIQNKDSLKILSQTLVEEKERKNVLDIYNQKYTNDNKNGLYSKNRKYGKFDSNSFNYKSSSNILNEIKETEEEEINLSNSDDKNNKSENLNEDGLINEETNIPNFEELISLMHEKTKNNSFKLYEPELNKLFIKFNNIDRSLLYNELNICVSYIINSTKRESLFNLHNSTFMKFFKKLTSKDDESNILFNQIKLGEAKEFNYSDNFNIIRYILDDIDTSSDIINSHVYLIFNDTLINKPNKNELLIKNNIDKSNEFVYLYIFIIPVSDEFWKIEFRLNDKKCDEFSKKLKNMIEKNFLSCYYFSIKNNFVHIIYHLKLLLSLLQDLICNIKDDIDDKKIKNKLGGIKHEEMLERINIFKSINIF